MKKTIFVAIAGLLMTASACAQTQPDSKVFALSLAKNGSQVWDSTVQLAEGQEAGVSRTSSQDYVKDCKPNNSGGIDYGTEKVSTGTRVALTSLSKDRDLEDLMLFVNHTKLISMLTFTQAPKCTVSAPSLQSVTISNRIRLKHGERIEIPASVGEDAYLLTIRLL